MCSLFFQFAFFSLSIFCSPQSQNIDHTPKKVVEWLSPCEHDFGIMKRDHPETFVFKFKNIASEEIVLQTVRTTCGCTAASWTESPIQPGDEGEVRIEYDAYQRGDFTKKIRVFFDKQRKADILKITGSVE